jgi:hypothetical protein
MVPSSCCGKARDQNGAELRNIWEDSFSLFRPLLIWRPFRALAPSMCLASYSNPPRPRRRPRSADREEIDDEGRGRGREGLRHDAKQILPRRPKGQESLAQGLNGTKLRPDLGKVSRKVGEASSPYFFARQRSLVCRSPGAGRAKLPVG